MPKYSRFLDRIRSDGVILIRPLIQSPDGNSTDLCRIDSLLKKLGPPWGWGTQHLDNGVKSLF